VALVAIVVLASVAAIAVLRAAREPIESSPVPATQPTPTASAQPSAPLHGVTGTVFEMVAGVRRPVPNVPVDVHVFHSGGGYSLWYALGHPITADANGQFSASLLNSYPACAPCGSAADLGDSFLVLAVAKSGYVQPRAATVTLHQGAVVDIELVELQNASAPLLPSPADSPTISGVVYETTPNGRRPVPGALVTVEWTEDVTTATTQTNADGRYWLGRIPAGRPEVYMYASKPGYRLTEITVTHTTDVVVDLELKPGP
jgi:hypothetical protein